MDALLPARGSMDSESAREPLPAASRCWLCGTSAERALYAECCFVKHSGVAGRGVGKTAAGTAQGCRATARVHHPTLVIDKYLDLTLRANTLDHLFHQQLPIIGRPRRDKKSSAAVGNVGNAVSHFVHNTSLLQRLGGQQALYHADALPSSYAEATAHQVRCLAAKTLQFHDSDICRHNCGPRGAASGTVV
jgi:hypothetical protein